MEWTPFSRAELDDLIASDLERMGDAVQVAWRAMRIEPEKWQCSPWGDEGGGFWVVAERAGRVVWYNDIEDGFNTSSFTTHGRIDEYFCNQTTFAEFLLGLPEAQEVENWKADSASGRVPLELQNGGTISRRQTTYWNLRAADGSKWRLHFKSKAEIRSVEPPFAAVGIFARHPILDQYRERWAELYFSGLSVDPGTLLGTLGKKVGAASAGWRRIDKYLNKGIDLRMGFGLLMRGPLTLVNIAAAVISDLGGATSIFSGSSPTAGMIVAIMGGNAIVAGAFRFEQRDSD